MPKGERQPVQSMCSDHRCLRLPLDESMHWISAPAARRDLKIG